MAMTEDPIYWRYLPYIRSIFQAYVREFPLMIMLGVFFQPQLRMDKILHLNSAMLLPSRQQVRCIPTSSILIRFSIINQPFFGVPLFMETHIWGYTIQYIGDDHSIMVNPTYY